MRIYGITYGDKTTEFTPYSNDHAQKPWRFEYGPMISICDGSDVAKMYFDELLGIFSWKFPQKTGLHVEDIVKMTHPIKVGGYDIINLSPRFSYPIAGKFKTFMDWSEDGHPGITRFIRMCCALTDMEYLPDPPHVVYANQFLARKSVYKDYIETIIKPSLELLEGPLWHDVNKPAGYTAGLLPDQLKAHTGLEFYNYIPFILERLLMQYIANRKIKTIDLL